jgi:hypothetical protein
MTLPEELLNVTLSRCLSAIDMNLYRAESGEESSWLRYLTSTGLPQIAPLHERQSTQTAFDFSSLPESIEVDEYSGVKLLQLGELAIKHPYLGGLKTAERVLMDISEGACYLEKSLQGNRRLLQFLNSSPNVMVDCIRLVAESHAKWKQIFEEEPRIKELHSLVEKIGQTDVRAMDENCFWRQHLDGLYVELTDLS